MLVLSIQSSRQGVVSQCVCVESSSWFHSLNRQDHDMTPLQRLTLPRVRFKVNGVVSTLVLGGGFWVGSCRRSTGRCCVCLLGSLLWSVVLLTKRLRDWFWLVFCGSRSVFLWFQVVKHNPCAYAFFGSSGDHLTPSVFHGR